VARRTARARGARDGEGDHRTLAQSSLSSVHAVEIRGQSRALQQSERAPQQDPESSLSMNLSKLHVHEPGRVRER